MDLATYLQDEGAAVKAIAANAIRDDYNAKAPVFQAQFVAMTVPDHRDFLTAIGQYGAGGKCLDVGCSYGAQKAALAANFPTVAWYGCDIAAALITKATAVIGPSVGRLMPVASGNYWSMPQFANASYDVVTSRSVLCWYDSPHGFAILDEMVRIASKAVVIKLYREPQFDTRVVTPQDGGAREGMGFIIEWPLSDWQKYLSDKKWSNFNDNPRVIVIQKA